MVSYMQVLVTSSSTVHNTKYLDPTTETTFSGGSRNFDRGVPNHPNHKVGGGQNLCFSKKTFFFFSFFHIFTFSVHISSASVWR